MHEGQKSEPHTSEQDRQTCWLLLDMYKHYFKTKILLWWPQLLTIDSREDQHFRMGNRWKGNQVCPSCDKSTSIQCRGQWYGDRAKKREFKDCFSRFVQNEHAQFEQHHPGSKSSLWTSIEVLAELQGFQSSKIWQASLKASCPFLLEENCWSSSWAFHTPNKWPQGCNTPRPGQSLEHGPSTSQVR